MRPEPSGLPVRRAVFVSILAVLLTLPAWLPRWQAESAHPGIELAVTGSAVALWEGQAMKQKSDPAAVLPTLQRSGVATVVIGMRQVADAVARRQVAVADARAIRRVGLTSQLPARLSTGSWVASAPDDPTGTWRVLEGMLRARAAASGRTETLASTRVETSDGWVGYLRFDSRAPIRTLPAGYDRTRITQAVGAHLGVVLALPARSPAPAAWLTPELASVATAATTKRFVVPDGRVVNGPTEQKVLTDFFGRTGATVIVPDDAEEEVGFGPVVDSAPGRVVRAHFVPATVVDPADTIVQRGRWAVKERSVRLVVVQTPAVAAGAVPRVPADVGLRSLAWTVQVLQTWRDDMPTGLGSSTPAPIAGPAAPLPVLAPSFVVRGATILGGFVVIAFGIYSLTDIRVRWWGPKIRRLLSPALAAVLFCAISLGCLFTWLRNDTRLLQMLMLAVAIAAAIAGVLVAMTRQAPPARMRDPVPAVNWWGYVGRYLGGLVTATAGGIVLAALGATNHWMLPPEAFLGQTALLIAPVAVVGIAGIGAARADMAAVGERSQLGPVARRVVLAVAAVVVVALGVVYVVRSGDAGLATAPERWVRDRLDAAVFVRPGFRELVVGCPALLLALRWPGAIGRWICATVAAVGTASILATFSIFSMPMTLQLLRTGYAVFGGLLLGLALAATLPAVIGPVRETVRPLMSGSGESRPQLTETR